MLYSRRPKYDWEYETNITKKKSCRSAAKVKSIILLYWNVFVNWTVLYIAILSHIQPNCFEVLIFTVFLCKQFQFYARPGWFFIITVLFFLLFLLWCARYMEVFDTQPEGARTSVGGGIFAETTAFVDELVKVRYCAFCWVLGRNRGGGRLF